MLSKDCSAMDVFRSTDGTVSKYMHEDGSETALKLVKSVQSIVNPLTKKIESHHTDRNKYSVFISSSVGCFMKCKFCHLTLKGAQHFKLEEEQILSNLKEAIVECVNFNPQMRERFVKLSWMGMGDALNKSALVSSVTIKLLDWIFENNYAKGLDGVDLSTVMPKMKNDDWINNFHELEGLLKKYKINPVYEMDNKSFTNGFYSHKNIFRLFYSVESAIQQTRDKIIPNATLLSDALEKLKKYQIAKDGSEYVLIFHHLIIEGLNDSEEELDALIDFMKNNFIKNELRVLRYNFCAKSTLKESEHFVNQIRRLSDSLDFIKVQVSPGTEVSAACGQFIVKDFISKK